MLSLRKLVTIMAALRIGIIIRTTLINTLAKHIMMGRLTYVRTLIV